MAITDNSTPDTISITFLATRNQTGKTNDRQSTALFEFNAHSLSCQNSSPFTARILFVEHLEIIQFLPLDYLSIKAQSRKLTIFCGIVQSSSVWMEIFPHNSKLSMRSVLCAAVWTVWSSLWALSVNETVIHWYSTYKAKSISLIAESGVLHQPTNLGQRNSRIMARTSYGWKSMDFDESNERFQCKLFDVHWQKRTESFRWHELYGQQRTWIVAFTQVSSYLSPSPVGDFFLLVKKIFSFGVDFL